jgi:hypothetical protein
MKKLIIQKDLNIPIDKINVLSDFVHFCHESLSPTTDYKVFIVADREPTGIQTTAYYNPGNRNIAIYGKNRALVDVCRSIAHEMTHMRQDDMGQIRGPVQDIGGFHENQANSAAGALIKLFAKKSNSGRKIYE